MMCVPMGDRPVVDSHEAGPDLDQLARQRHDLGLDGLACDAGRVAYPLLGVGRRRGEPEHDR